MVKAKNVNGLMKDAKTKDFPTLDEINFVSKNVYEILNDDASTDEGSDGSDDDSEDLCEVEVVRKSQKIACPRTARWKKLDMTEQRTSAETIGPIGSTGMSLTSTEETSGSTSDQDAFRQTPKSKPCTGRRRRWKERKVAEVQKRAVVSRLSDVETPKTVSVGNGEVEKKWFDGEELCPLYEEHDDDDEDGPSHLLGTWRQEADGGWVRIEGVMDSGATVPVAPPTMCPNSKIRESEGSRRGMCYTSASKHKLPNLGEQHLAAQTEAGEDTSVLFQIADVSRPLISVSAICEMGNRVIFGRGGGVVQNLATGAETPFYRKNGIYHLNLWVYDGDSDFTRR